MKRKNIGLVLATLAVIGVGSLALILSVTRIKGSVQQDLSDETKVGMEVGTEIVEAEEDADSDTPINSQEDANIHYFENLSLEEALLQRKEELNLTKEELLQKREELKNQLTTVEFVYQGQEIAVKDVLVEKEEALKNATEVMDFVFGYVDETILTPYGIDKTEFQYEIQRQYGVLDKVDYAVFLMQKESIKCTIGIQLDSEPVLTSFARDGLIQLCGGERVIPEEYRVNNWCETTEKREAIYAEYLEESKEVIAMLGLPAIIESEKNVDCITYFDADDTWSRVVFGYVLEDGRYVKVFYNRVNQMWDGFVIAGYHQEYLSE
ncbi:MAG: hypothetical protein IJ419_00485 [Agathobacter sp.]|nr:hypothetical protein [Agathobacter sp.]